MESRVIKEMIAVRDRVFPDEEFEELHLNGVNQQMELGLMPEVPQMPGDGNEAALLGYLDGDPLHIDDFGRRPVLPKASVSGLLPVLEFKGLVKTGRLHALCSDAGGRLYLW